MLSLDFNDIFRTGESRAIAVVNGLRTRTTFYGDAQNFRLSVSYNLGNKKIRVKSQKRGNVEESRRVN